ncbi:MAG: hypothetical protein ACRDR6_17120 [Pseudonocardiaceae bacterium]
METTQADRARWAVQAQVREVAALLEGDGVRLERPSLSGPIGPGGLGPAETVADVEPLAGVRAALFVSRAATGQIREYAEQARGAGVSWQQLGEVLGLAEEATYYDIPLGEAAWSFVIEGIRPGQDHNSRRYQLSARWTCGVCGERITDRGPAEPSEGHADSCSRLAAEAAAYDRELSEGD